MSSLELYYEFTLLLNKNATNVNINIEKENFVWLYNREARKWLAEYIIKNSGNVQSINIEGLLSVNKPLVLIDSTSKYNSYILPDQFYDFVDSYSVAVKEDCENEISNFLQKPKELRTNIDNSFSNPSFKYEESICNIADNKLLVYKSDYTIKDTYLSYYKKVQEIDIEGYQKIDGSMSTNKSDGLTPYLQSQIIDRVVTEVMREFENTNGFKLAQERENA